MPQFLSDDCKNLISRMLVVNPLDRITIEEIMGHPWFNESVPEYINECLVSDGTEFKMDERIVKELAMKYDKPYIKVREKLEKIGDKYSPNYMTVAYQILNGTGKFPKESFKVATNLNLKAAQFSHSPPIFLRAEIPFYDQEGSVQNILKSLPDTIHSKPMETTNLKWYMGIMSQNTPDEITTQILQALKLLNIRWKIVGPYQLKCIFETNSDEELFQEIKIRMQLFVIDSVKKPYLLDVKLIKGEIFPFFNLCSKIVYQLKYKFKITE
eukprot:TRINITY_DN4022_c0_g1_i2.p1 TRINITY_DN4022_c0_g1~~TRINITY_DN4022_c0_g1_i2.p1  ORF type:complete len:269 (+),score=38.61 TRINITY_DN4022_c0_g1_i2:1064-1870(+)